MDDLQEFGIAILISASYVASYTYMAYSIAKQKLREEGPRITQIIDDLDLVKKCNHRNPIIRRYNMKKHNFHSPVVHRTHYWSEDDSYWVNPRKYYKRIKKMKESDLESFY